MVTMSSRSSPFPWQPLMSPLHGDTVPHSLDREGPPTEPCRYTGRCVEVGMLFRWPQATSPLSVCVCHTYEDIRCAYPPGRWYIWLIPRDRSSIKDLPNSIHDAYCKKSKTMPDFVAVKELVEQQVDSYRCSWASLVQALCIRRPLLQLQKNWQNVSKMYLNHGPMEA